MSKEAAAESKRESVYSFPRRILVPIDGSENSIRASEVAIELARKYGSELIILSVVSMPSFVTAAPVSLGAPTPDFNEYFNYARRDANRFVDQVIFSAKKQGVKARGEVIQSTSSVVEAITNTARGEKVELIVIGTRGLGGFRKLLLGSVSSGVVTHAHCNVLVVR